MSKVNVRYIVNDVDAAIPFYTDMLGFKVEMHPAPGFASLCAAIYSCCSTDPAPAAPDKPCVTVNLPPRAAGTVSRSKSRISKRRSIN